jgi:hypothetical protein
MTNRVFARWTVIDRAPHIGESRAWWLCRCVCGEVRAISGNELRGGRTQSCGCLRRERSSASNRTHGQSRTRLYGVWKGMNQRCYNPNNKYYADYGGRGIRVCDAWLDSFEAFREYMGDPPGRHHELDRFPDTNGNYEPGNVRWATRSQNCRNKRRNRLIEYRGERRCLTEWSELTGIPVVSLHTRLSRGWSIERALTESRHVGPTKVTEAKRIEARRLRDEGFLLEDIAARVGISRAHAWRITRKAS